MNNLQKIKLELLNNEESNHIRGGGDCNKTGDTIYCNLVSKILACAYEVGCKPNFSSSCGKAASFTINGCSSVTFS